MLMVIFPLRGFDVSPRPTTESHVQEQITRLSNQVASLVTTQTLNHQQNRKDINDLRDGQQRYIDALYTGFKDMSTSLEKAITPIKADIFDLQMWKSKTTGYVVGISALAALVFKVVEVGLSKVGMK